MKIVIIAGGTGSVALQRGIFNGLESKVEGVDVKVIVNAYDNGLSTGAVRTVCGGKILGPSDVRKNHTTRLKLECNEKSPWIPFLDMRFTTTAESAKRFCYVAIDELGMQLAKICHQSADKMHMLKDAVDMFFQAPLSMSIDYTDFSLANIIYAGLARSYNNSLRSAASQMAYLIGIKDNVLLNDDYSLFLGAITKSGKQITDEGDIVSWGDTTDPFVDVFFTDAKGESAKPMLCREAKEALYSADLIILSTGTQWSSLIPTYESEGFKDAIAASSAKVIMVMNQKPDADSPGQSAEELLDILVPKYFDVGRLNVIIAANVHPLMRKVSDVTNLKTIIHSVGSLTGMYDDPGKHNPDNLFDAISAVYFREYLNSDYFMFDYDDTLVARGNKSPKASDINLEVLKKIADRRRIGICTGNSVKAVNIKPNNKTSHFGKPPSTIEVFADGGVNQYEFTTDASAHNGKAYGFVQCLNHEMLLTNIEGGLDRIVNLLLAYGISPSKIERRGDVMISIKPIENEYRPIVFNLLEMVFKKEKLDLVVRQSGRTTVEMCRSGLSKEYAVRYVLTHPNVKTITYVGDEFKNGNDAIVGTLAQQQEYDSRIKCLAVDNPAKTAMFLIALDSYISKFEGVRSVHL